MFNNFELSTINYQLSTINYQLSINEFTRFKKYSEPLV